MDYLFSEEEHYQPQWRQRKKVEKILNVEF